MFKKLGCLLILGAAAVHGHAQTTMSINGSPPQPVTGIAGAFDANGAAAAVQTNLAALQASVTNTVTAGVGGVTVNTFVGLGSTNPSTFVTASLNSVGSGVALSTAAAGATFTLSGPNVQVQVLADGAINANDLVIGSATTPGYATDSGQTSSQNICSTVLIAGTALTSTTGAGQLVTINPRSRGSYGHQICPNSLPPFVASGPSHAPGAVPDPGPTAGTTRYLNETGSWTTPSSSGASLPAGTGVVNDVSGTGNVITNDQLESTGNNLIALNEGDSIDCCVGVLNGNPMLTQSNVLLQGLGVQYSNIVQHAISGSGVNYIADRIINTGAYSPSSLTVWDGYENNGTTTNTQAWWSLYHANEAIAIWASTLDPVYDQTGFPAKVYATNPQVTVTTGTATASADFPTPGQTCAAATCTFNFANVPGTDVHVLLEVVGFGYGVAGTSQSGKGNPAYPIGYTPAITVDGVTIPGSWQNTTASWLQILPEIDGYAWAPYDIHVKAPNDGLSGSNYGGNGKHIVTVTVPQYVTIISVIGSGGDKQTSFPKAYQIGQGRWFHLQNNYTVAANNAASLNSDAEVWQAGNAVGFYDPSNDWDGYASPTAVITGCTVTPEVSITTSPLTGAVTGFVNTPGFATPGGSGCGTVTITMYGGLTGTGASISCAPVAGSCPTYTINSAGTGYFGIQVFDTNQGHPNTIGAGLAGNGALAKFRPLSSPRNADAGQGIINSGINHQEQALDYGTSANWLAPQAANASTTLAGAALVTSPFINVNGYFAMTTKTLVDSVTITADPGVPGKCTKLRLSAGVNGYTAAFDANIYVGNSNSYVDNVPTGNHIWDICYKATPTNNSKSYRYQATLVGNDAAGVTPLHQTGKTASYGNTTLLSIANNPDPLSTYDFNCAVSASANTGPATISYTLTFTDQFGISGRTYTSPTITPTTSGSQPTWGTIREQISNAANVQVQTTVTGTGLVYNLDCTGTKVWPQIPYLQY